MDQKKITKTKIKLTIREILLTFCDAATKAEEIVGYRWQRREAYEYWKWRDLDKQRFHTNLCKLQQQGYIEQYKKGKNKIIKLTAVGEKKAIKYLTKELSTKIPQKWNKKWHMIIFDIPENKKNLRDIVRQKLNFWNFYQLQKSVFIHPFCHEKEIAALKYLYNIGDYLQYCIVNTIETELDLVNLFYEKGILTKSHIVEIN